MDAVGVNGQIGVAGFEGMAGKNAVGEVDETGPLKWEGSQWSHLTPNAQ
jgi:hypothetical protein